MILAQLIDRLRLSADTVDPWEEIAKTPAETYQPEHRSDESQAPP